MPTKDQLDVTRHMADAFKVTDGKGFRLKDFDPGNTGGFAPDDKQRGADTLRIGIELLADMQARMYAQDRWALLLVFQAMDAAGKDGVIKHVMSGVNPQGCEVHSFKAPSEEELDHDFLWRCAMRLPQRGRIGIFNRSYYEDVLVVRVHPELLAANKIPPELVTKGIWDDRHKDIRRFEKYLSRNGIAIRKFFLHVSRDEQKKRILERLNDPDKNWKYSAVDVRERRHWDAYMDAYEDTIRATATEDAPWYVVPADNKWFTRVIVAAAIVDALASLHVAYPVIDPEKHKELDAARAQLMSE